MARASRLIDEIEELKKDRLRFKALGGRNGCGCAAILALISLPLFVLFWPAALVLLALSAVVLIVRSGRGEANNAVSQIDRQLRRKRKEFAEEKKKFSQSN